MKNIQKLIFVVLLSSFSINSNGQSGNYGSAPNILPADVATLGKFGSYPVSYYTGTANVGIPLFDFSDRDILVNIGLQYDGSGFVPNKEPGTVGINWALSSGGVITRVVNWIGDDQIRSDISGSLSKGFIYGINSVKTLYNKESIRNLSFLTINSQGAPIFNLAYEYCPDVFSFNFGEYHGQFFMGNDGKIKVVCDKPLKVDVSQMNAESDLILGYASSTITITTENGDSYTFGGAFNTVDINFSYSGVLGANPVVDGKTAYINAWHLTKIKTHNGNVVNFEYTPQNTSDFYGGTPTQGVPSSIDYGYEKLYRHEELSFYDGSQGQWGSTPQYLVYQSFVKKTYLSKITGNAGSVEFSYSPEVQRFYKAGENIRSPNIPKKLDQLTIKDPNGALVKIINLNYTYYGSSTVGYREMLTGIKTIGGQDTATYSMDYYRTSELPDPLTKGIDIWGFYNGRNGNTTLIPTVSSGSPDYTVDWSSSNSYRLADTSYCNVGLLHHITYPTKGTTEFIYEGNSYSKILRKTVTGGMVPVTYTENGYTGGARIKKIIDNPGTEREFKYLNNFTFNGTGLSSSGIAIQPNVYYFDLTYYYTGSGNDKYVDISDQNVTASSSYSAPAIGYAEVTEIFKSNGYTKYYYSNQLTNPDKYTLGDDSYTYFPKPDNSLSNYIQQLKRIMWPSSCELERGKVTQMASYDQSNNLLKKTITKYNENVNRYDSSVIGFTWPGVSGIGGPYDIYQSFGLYYFNTQPTYSQTTEYSGGQSLVSGTGYGYNSNRLLAYIRDTTSKGEAINTSFTYPTDYTGSPYDSMVYKNMLSSIIEKDITNNGIPVKHSKITYFRSTSGLYLPQSLDEKNGSFSLQRVNNYLNYDRNGHLLEFSSSDGIKQVFLWGYNSEYPVAKITGSDYNTVRGFIDSTKLDNAVYFSDADIRTELNKIRIGLANTTAQVFTYTFKPLIGMTSETDPKNYTVYYEYDGSGRLKDAKDKDGNVIKKYGYHYIGQQSAAEETIYSNVLKSGTFTKNDCNTGYSGNSVTYFIPAGRYTSTFSQTDADQQALNDISANGQAFANANGSCTVTNYDFEIESDFTYISGSLSMSLSTVSGSLTFSSTDQFSHGISRPIASIINQDYLPGITRTFYSGSWLVTVNVIGVISITWTGSGTAPPGNITINISYSI